MSGSGQRPAAAAGETGMLNAWSRFCFNGSVLCVFLYIALCSFDISPWRLIPWRPEVVPYCLGMAGCCFLFCSGRWLRLLPRVWPLAAGLALFLGWAAFAAWLAGKGHPEQVARYALRSLVKHWGIPSCFIIWSAMTFSLLPRARARSLFFAATMTLAALNSVHILGELAANAGIQPVKSFLISINHFFRLEKIGHGWWPPVFWEGRIRGLFAEPSHLAFALLPALGLFLYKSLQQRIWLLAVAAWLGVMVLGAITSGLLSFAIVFFLFLLPALHRLYRRHARGFSLVLASLFCATLLAAWPLAQRKCQQMEPYIDAAASLCAYVHDAHEGKNPVWHPLQINLGASSLNTRLVTNWLDIDMGLAHPLGIGFFLRGFYWKPLDNCDLARSGEIRGYVLQARDDPFRGIPLLNQYTCIFAECGWPGLFLFCSMLFWFLLWTIACAKKRQDRYLWCIACAFTGMCAAFMVIPLVNFHMFFVFTGYLYSISSSREQETSPSRSRVKSTSTPKTDAE